MSFDNCLSIGRIGSNAHPDHELITKIEVFTSIERHCDRLYVNGSAPILDDDERDLMLEPFRERQSELLNETLPMRATTLEGVFSRMEMLISADRELLINEIQGDAPRTIVAALVRDLLEMRDKIDATHLQRREQERRN